MTFVTRPNLDNNAFRQESGTTLTLTGTTNFIGILQSKGTEIDADSTGALDGYALKYVGGVIRLVEEADQAITQIFNQTTHGFTGGTVVGYNGSAWEKAVGHITGTSEPIGIVTNVIDANNFELTFGGYITGTTSYTDYSGGTLVGGQVYFVHPSSPAGTLTKYKPVAEGEVEKPMLSTFGSNDGVVTSYRGNIITGTTVNPLTGASNGLRVVSSGARLGGPLIENTEITGNFNLGISANTITLSGSTGTLLGKAAFTQDFSSTYGPRDVPDVNFVTAQTIGGGDDTEILFARGSSIDGNSGFKFEYTNTALTLGSRSGTVGNFSTTLGFNNCASGLHSLSTGYDTISSGNQSFSGGYYTRATGVNSFAFGNYAYACGNISFAVGNYACAIGNNSVAIGTGAVIANGNCSIAIGNSRAYGGYALSIGNFGRACGNYSMSLNSGRAYGTSSFALGNGGISRACGTGSVAFPTGCAIGGNSFAGGDGDTSRVPLASGFGSFIWSRTTNAGVTATEGAAAAYSAILGGQNHNIASGNTRAAILGGDTIKLTGTSYIDYVAVPNLALWDGPETGTTTDQILVYDVDDKKVKRIGAITVDLNSYPTTIITGTSVTLTNSSDFVQLVSGATGVTMPASPDDEIVFKIKDVSGNAASSNITISGNGKNIEGQPSATINSNYGNLEFIFNATLDEWYILSFY